MYAIFCAIVIGVAMVFLDQTVLPVALPVIQKQLHATSGQLHWMINGYLLVLAVFVLAGGRLADTLGKRRIFCWGMALFALASIACGLSVNPAMLVASRFVQGLGSALILPTTIPLLLSVFPENKKGWVVGLHTACAALFLSIGPLVGGFVTQYFSWRYLFFMNIPLALAGILLTLWLVPRSSRREARFDVWGFGYYSLAIVCLTVGLIQVESWGWGSLYTLLCFFFGIGFLLLLYFEDRRASDPFIAFQLFRYRAFNEAAIAIFLVAFQLIIIVFLPLYMQKALTLSPISAGMLLALTSLPLLFMAPLAGKLLDRYGFEFPVVLGQVITTLSFIWMMACVGWGTFMWAIPGLMGLGMGLATMVAPAFSSGISAIMPEHRGVATGLLSTMRSLGANFGVALTGSAILEMQRVRLFHQLSEDEVLASIPLDLADGMVRAVPSAWDALQQLPLEIQQGFMLHFNRSYQFGFGAALLLDVLLGCLGLVAAFIWFHRKRKGI